MSFLPPLLYVTIPAQAAALIGISLFISICLVALLYMLSSFIQHAQLQAMAKEEFAALVFTIIIIAFWLSSDTLLNSAVSGILRSTLPSNIQINLPDCSGVFAQRGCRGGFSTGHMDLADASLELLWQKLKAHYTSLYLFEILIGFLSTISFPIGAPVLSIVVISFSLSPFVGLNLLSQAHTVIVEAISTLMAMIWAKQFILYFARDAVPLIFLPLGLVMRAFPLFRTTGSTLIALCFALYFAYPFALLFSNYLIFDVYQPADFTYNPASASPFSSARGIGAWRDMIMGGHDGTEVQHLRNQFTAPDVVQQASASGQAACDGPALRRMFCSASNLFSSAWNGVSGMVNTGVEMWRFMIGMTGDFAFTLFNNPTMPSSISAGLFYFIIQEVSIEGPFIVLVMIMTVFEIIITITTFRNVSLLMGGEAEIIGLGKLI